MNVNIIKPKDDKGFVEKLVWFYDPLMIRHHAYSEALANTDLIIFCEENGKIKWSARVKTDGFMFFFLFDLLVGEEYRMQWVGSSIINAAIDEAVKIWIKSVDLISDPEHEWLIWFYEKFWFKQSIENWTYMSKDIR